MYFLVDNTDYEYYRVSLNSSIQYKSSVSENATLIKIIDSGDNNVCIIRRLVKPFLIMPQQLLNFSKETGEEMPGSIDTTINWGQACEYEVNSIAYDIDMNLVMIAGSNNINSNVTLYLLDFVGLTYDHVNFTQTYDFYVPKGTYDPINSTYIFLYGLDENFYSFTYNIKTGEESSPVFVPVLLSDNVYIISASGQTFILSLYDPTNQMVLYSLNQDNGDVKKVWGTTNYPAYNDNFANRYIVSKDGSKIVFFTSPIKNNPKTVIYEFNVSNYTTTSVTVDQFFTIDSSICFFD